MEPAADPTTKGPVRAAHPQTAQTQTEGRVFPRGWDFVLSVSVSSSEEIPLQILFLAVRSRRPLHRGLLRHQAYSRQNRCPALPLQPQPDSLSCPLKSPALGRGHPSVKVRTPWCGERTLDMASRPLGLHLVLAPNLHRPLQVTARPA